MTEGPQPCADRPAAEERRAVPRYVLSWGSFCRLAPYPECRCERVLVHDISAHGLALIFAEPPPLGAVLALQVPSDGGAAARWTGAEVRHATRLATRVWLVGCALTRPLSDEDLRALVGASEAVR
jgi:hypothetical protein